MTIPIQPATICPSDDRLDVPDDDVEWTRRMIDNEQAALAQDGPGARRYHELRLAGWYRHLEYAEAERQRQ